MLCLRTELILNLKLKSKKSVPTTPCNETPSDLDNTDSSGASLAISKNMAQYHMEIR